MRSARPRSGTIDRRGVILTLALAGIFGSSAASSISAVAENTPANHHKDLIDRYLQAISEQDGSGGAAAPIGDASEEKQSCFAGWDASCQDNPSFLSVMGASCKMHERFDCTMLHAIGYTEVEVWEVVTNCPCSCEVSCGQWTITPSAAPSSMPSSTPSARPSASPTSQPSDAPSSSPTSSPSSSPSAAPSVAPTASPSSAPSQSPTISMMPSSSPTAFPSAAPSSSPSSSPTSPPSTQPTQRPTFTPKPSPPPTATPTSSPTISLPPTQSETVGFGDEESKGSSGKIGGILAAFAGVSGVVALAYCAKRGRFNKSWGEPVNSFGSKDDTLTAEEYNNGYPFSGGKNSSLADLEYGDNIEKCPSAIDQLYSASQESTGSFHIPIVVEDRIEIVEVPAMQSSNSLGSGGGSFDVQLSKSISKSFAEGDLEMITEVSVGDSNSVDEDFSTGHSESDLEKITEVSVGGNSSFDEDFYSGYGADDDSAYRQQRAEAQPKTYRRRRAPAQRTPPRPDAGNRTPGRDNIIRSAPRSGRPPLFASPGIQRSDSIGRMTMLSTPQSVDSESSVELVLPHEGSI